MVCSLSPRVQIHARFRQQRLPVDHDKLTKYAEVPDGQTLHRASASSMFGFQRVGDLIWQGPDARARGVLLVATGGRITLNGEELQHQDGHSLLMALTTSAVVCWDPPFAYKLACIIKHGMQWTQEVIHYITLYDEDRTVLKVPKDPNFNESLLNDRW